MIKLSSCLCPPQVVWPVVVFSQCALTTDCIGATGGEKVADPTNCNQYYYCIGPGQPSIVPVPCNDPLAPYFDAGTSCDCSGTPAVCDSTPFCTYTCGTEDDINFVSDPDDCNLYHVCLPSGISGPLACTADEPYFDGTNEICVADEGVCCVAGPPSCGVTCLAAGTQIPDPYDCTMFYLCFGEGPANSIHASCPEGEVFDEEISDCSPTAECVEPCAG